MTQISVVIPVYNYAMLLTRAVESVVNQPGEGFEVIIVDDGSTDETESVAKSLMARFPPHHFVQPARESRSRCCQKSGYGASERGIYPVPGCG